MLFFMFLRHVKFHVNKILFTILFINFFFLNNFRLQKLKICPYKVNLILEDPILQFYNFYLYKEKKERQRSERSNLNHRHGTL